MDIRKQRQSAIRAKSVTEPRRSLEENKAASVLLSLNRDPLYNQPSSTGVPFFTSTQGIEPSDTRLGKISKTLFGEDELKTWKQKARKIYELTEPNEQCPGVGKTLNETTSCWLCGFRVRDTADQSDGMKAVCEHVLPIGQAVFFLGLYSKRVIKPSEDIPAVSNEIYELEYEWGHHVCNQEKLDIVLIERVEDEDYGTPKWIPHKDNIKSMLLKIQKSSRADAVELKTLITNDKNWFNTRLVEVTKRITKITDFINRTTKDERGTGNLTELAGWSSLVDPTNINKKFLSQIGVTMPPNVVESRKRRSDSDASQPTAKRRDTKTASGRRRKRNRKTLRKVKH